MEWPLLNLSEAARQKTLSGGVRCHVRVGVLTGEDRLVWQCFLPVRAFERKRDEVTNLENDRCTRLRALRE